MKRLLIQAVTFVAIMLVFSACSETARIAKDPLGYLSQNSWVLHALNGSMVPNNLFMDKLPSLKINPEGAVSGYTGCNNMTGAKLDMATGLDISKTAMTRMACPGDGETMFLDALGDATSVKIDPGELKFLGAEGQELLKFIPEK